MQFEKNQLIISIVTICSVIGLLVIFYILIIVRNYRANLNRKIVFFKEVIQVQESERKRIGMNIHDEIGAHLSLVKLKIDAMTYSKDLLEVKQIGDETKVFVDNMFREIRGIVHALVPKNLEKLGLLIVIDDLVRELNRYQEFVIDFGHKNIPEKRFPIHAEIDLYRIIQELLNNAIKHSKATKIELQIQYTEPILEINYKDDGMGFEPDQDPKGFGMKNILARVNIYAGRMLVNIHGGPGTSVDLFFHKKNLS